MGGNYIIKKDKRYYDAIKVIVEKTEQYYGLKRNELKTALRVFSNSKSINYLLMNKMLNFSNIDFEKVDFITNNFIFKTVALEFKGNVRESMSFPKIDFIDMCKNDWQSSETYKYFAEKTICIGVFQKTNDDQVFKKVIFLDLSTDELNQIFLIWERVKNLIINNELKIGGKYGYSVLNFPNKKSNPVTHVRPHDSNSASGKSLLPDGKRIMNYSFWLNNEFIESKIKEMKI